MYKTRIVVLEQGHNRDLRLCFFGFKQLSEVYIPNSIMKIGEKAFNPKTSPKFNMPSTIRESDLLAGNVIYTKAGISNNSDPLAGIDLSIYGDGAATGKDEVTAVKSSAPKMASITPGTSDIDMNIPRSSMSRENTFCLIVANGNMPNTPNVKYAEDGKTFEGIVCAL